ncbi:MAG: 30S ribosomal protein S21 [Patescibacteria group bacterium]
MPIVVKGQPGQSSDQVIRAFQKKVFNEDIIEELKKREFYQKPALIKKARNAAIKKAKKQKRIY